MKQIFVWFTLATIESRIYTQWFVDTFGDEPYEGIDRMLIMFLKYCTFLGIPAKQSYLQIFLKTEAKQHVKEYDIRTESMNLGSYDNIATLEEATRIVSETTIDYYNEYSSVDITDREFRVDIYEYMRNKKKELIRQDVMSQNFLRMQRGDDIDEIAVSLENKIAEINFRYDLNLLSKLDFLVGNESRTASTSNTIMRKIATWGIPAVDESSGGIFSQQIITYTGLPGSGKTRFFCKHVVYQTAVVHKKGVLVHTLELSIVQYKNILVAIHIVNMFGGRVKIPDTLINRDELTDEQRSYVEAARADLFESGKYGRIRILRDELYVDKINTTHRSFFRFNPDIEVWVVDYLALVKRYEPKRYSSNEPYAIVTEGLDEFNKLKLEADIAVCLLCQYNDAGVHAARNGKTIVEGMVQAGHAIQRYSDFDFVSTCTEEQEIANVLSFHTVKCRSATKFKNLMIEHDLSISAFRAKNVVI